MTYRPLAGVAVVGITGAARSGKDELARAIIRNYPGAERFAFSDGVAAIARARYFMGARDAGLLQQIGTLYRSTRGTEVWLRCLYGAIADRRPRLAVVTGIRYPNELDLIRALGGMLVGIVRPGRPPLTDRDPAHEVESHVDGLLREAPIVVEAAEYGEARRGEAFNAHARRVLSLIVDDAAVVDITGAPI
jgi:hypothetical protein